MDYSKICAVSSEKEVTKVIDRRVQDNSSALEDIFTDRRKENRVRSVNKIQDSTVRKIMSLPRQEKRKVLSKLPDSDRRKVLSKYNKIKDDKEQDLFDLSKWMDQYILYFDAQSKEELKTLKKKIPEHAGAIQKVIDLEPIERSEFESVFGELKQAFLDNGVAVPPLVLLQDSAKKKGFSARVGEKLILVKPQFLTDANNIVVASIADSSKEYMITAKDFFKDGKRITDEELDKLFEGEDEDDVKAVEEEDLDDGEENNGNEEEEDLLEAPIEETTEENPPVNEIIEALISFKETGDVEELKPLIGMDEVSDSVKALITDDIDDEKYQELINDLVEEAGEGYKEKIKEAIEQKDLELEDSYSPRITIPRAGTSKMFGKLSKNLYQSAVVKDHHRAAVTLAKLYKQNYLPAKSVTDGKLIFGKKVQELIPIDDSVSKNEKDKNKFVTVDSYNRAAAKLGFLELIDSALFKDDVNSEQFCCYEAPLNALAACENCPEQVESLKGTEGVVIVISPCEIDPTYNNASAITEDYQVNLYDSVYHIRAFK